MESNLREIEDLTKPFSIVAEMSQMENYRLLVQESSEAVAQSVDRVTYFFPPVSSNPPRRVAGRLGSVYTPASRTPTASLPAPTPLRKQPRITKSFRRTKNP